MKNIAWGQHLILNLGDCNDHICSKDKIELFVKELIQAIDMKAYGEPIIEYFAEHSQEAAGYSLVQLIETSAISGHFSENNKDAYLDIFSCKAFAHERVNEVVKKHFNPKSIQSLLLYRDAKLPQQEPFKIVS
jgi:S-adenosylmethionine/arginine decarboxylase-like enzyme